MCKKILSYLGVHHLIFRVKHGSWDRVEFFFSPPKVFVCLFCFVLFFTHLLGNFFFFFF